MDLKHLVKLGTIVSVLLFGLAVGYYMIMRLDLIERNQEVVFYSFIPSDCIAVLESDNINGFLNDSQMYNYNRELDAFKFPGLFDFLLGELNTYAMENGHGLSTQMSRLAISFHSPLDSREQVLYLRMGMSDEQMLADMLQEYTSGYSLPKDEIYRGKNIRVYPLDTDEFLAIYADNGVFVMSYQKRLIEKVIDARLDKASLDEDELFTEMRSKKKGENFLTLYGHSSAMPFLEVDKECWSEYDFHLNSDVMYLMGRTYVIDASSCEGRMRSCIREVETVRREGLVISSERDSINLYMNQAVGVVEEEMPDLFDECVANLSVDAMFTLVADMQEVADNPRNFQSYLPSFVLDNVALFSRFILSVQLSAGEGYLSHIWVFTYKD